MLKSHDGHLITFEQLKLTSAVLKRHPYKLSIEAVWQAYGCLKGSLVKDLPLQATLTDLISLVCFESGAAKTLVPFVQVAERRFLSWQQDQENRGRRFVPGQLDFLNSLKNHIALRGSVSMEDLDFLPQYQGNGAMKMYQLFGTEMEQIVADLNKNLIGSH